MSRELLKLFTTNEIMRWKELLQIYESELRTAFPGSDIFSAKTEEGAKRWADLKVRVVEHVSCQIQFIHVSIAVTAGLCWNCFQNIRVMAGYYTRIYIKRMANLLDLTEAVSVALLHPARKPMVVMN